MTQPDHDNNKNSGKLFLLQTLFLSIIAIFTMNRASYLYATLTHTAPIDWGLTGRWLVMLMHGQFFTPAIEQLPSIRYEWLIGFAFHDCLSFGFALTYLLLLKHYFKTKPTAFNGVLFGLSLSGLSLFIEQPSMGFGILGLNTAQPLISLLHTLFFHASFGLGLGIAGSLSCNFFTRYSARD